MNKCLFCGEEKAKGRPKFCSIKCSKRSWYEMKHPESFRNDSEVFWKSCTGKGFIWEKYASNLLGAEHLVFNRSGADLQWGEKLVDVKSANLYKRKLKRGKPVSREQKGVWVFNRNKFKKVDWFLCFCLVDNKLVKTLLIPFWEFSQSGIVIGENSKYDRFAVNGKLPNR